jgi:hypothetical protein
MRDLSHVFANIEFGSVDKALATLAGLKGLRLPEKAMMFALSNDVRVLRDVHQKCKFDPVTSQTIVGHCLRLGGDAAKVRFLLQHNYQFSADDTRYLFNCPSEAVQLVKKHFANRLATGVKDLVRIGAIYQCIGSSSPEIVEQILTPTALNGIFTSLSTHPFTVMRDMFFAASLAMIKWLVVRSDYRPEAISAALISMASMHVTSITYPSISLFQSLLSIQDSCDFDPDVIDRLIQNRNVRFLKLLQTRYQGLELDVEALEYCHASHTEGVEHQMGHMSSYAY